ncbi:MAG TPA: exodeoxyribonuclease VII large subunit [Actinomycetales bacterium]|nr:exodeoxyribonuclease VII large subunit [Actinomycetales bacterium]
MTDAPRPRLPETAGQTTAENPWPVRLLTAKISTYVSKMPVVWVEGQLVQVVRRPGAATAYLTLRDADVDMSLPVTAHVRVLDALGEGLREGARVVVRARPEFWTKRGSLQLVADQVRPVGVGELLARVEHLKRVLAAEGLFDPGRKKTLPFLPRTVGLVCGRASAAEHDVVVTARHRWPGVAFDVREVVVQGSGAVEAVAGALAALDAEPAVDVIVVARGGGSLEDLLPFSNETLLRAVAACRTPVVSAIGHEVDAPLLDLVADVRASTPTDAGRRIVPAVAEEAAGLAQVRGRLRRVLASRLDGEVARLAAVRGRPVIAEPWRALDERAVLVGAGRDRARRALGGHLDRAGDQVAHLRSSVRALSPAATLERGYAVVQAPDGAVLRASSDAAPDDELRVRLAAGEIDARVTAVRPS